MMGCFGSLRKKKKRKNKSNKSKNLTIIHEDTTASTSHEGKLKRPMQRRHWKEIRKTATTEIEGPTQLSKFHLEDDKEAGQQNIEEQRPPKQGLEETKKNYEIDFVLHHQQGRNTPSESPTAVGTTSSSTIPINYIDTTDGGDLDSNKDPSLIVSVAPTHDDPTTSASAVAFDYAKGPASPRHPRPPRPPPPALSSEQTNITQTVSATSATIKSSALTGTTLSPSTSYGSGYASPSSSQHSFQQNHQYESDGVSVSDLSKSQASAASMHLIHKQRQEIEELKKQVERLSTSIGSKSTVSSVTSSIDNRITEVAAAMTSKIDGVSPRESETSSGILSMATMMTDDSIVQDLIHIVDAPLFLSGKYSGPVKEEVLPKSLVSSKKKKKSKKKKQKQQDNDAPQGNQEDEESGDGSSNSSSNIKLVPHGIGIIRFDNGDTYEGPFRNGQLHGPNGVYLWAHSGAVYKGSFKKNLRQGYGETKFNDGDRRYVGSYDSGKPHGYGEQYMRNGDLYYKGQWEDGEPEGQMIPFMYRNCGNHSVATPNPGDGTSTTGLSMISEITDIYELAEDQSTQAGEDRSISRYATDDIGSICTNTTPAQSLHKLASGEFQLMARNVNAERSKEEIMVQKLEEKLRYIDDEKDVYHERYGSTVNELINAPDQETVTSYN